MKKKSIIKKIALCTFMLLMLLSAIGCVNIENGQAVNNLNESTNNFLSSSNASATISDIPAYSGKAYVEINENKPNFSTSDLTTTSFEKYSPLDELGRCGIAFANVGTDIMPTSERESISSVKPTGWQTVKYDSISGKYLYNRCHLIGFQLTAENANELNLITGTRYLNVDGMLPFENMVADYVKETNNHVLYRVTPVFEGNDLVAKGVQIEALSVEDNGEGIEFNVFIYNVQPGITIDYSTGNSALGENTIIDVDSSNSNASNQSNGNTSSSQTSTTESIIRGNSKSKIYHCPGQRDYENMADSEYLVTFNSENEAIEAGYRKAKR